MHNVSEQTNGKAAAIYTRLAVLEQKLDSHMEADEKFQEQSIENQKKSNEWIEKIFIRMRENQDKTEEKLDKMRLPVYMGMGMAVALPTAIEIYRLLTGK